MTSSRALLLKQWNWRENKCVRTWKAVHVAPVASMAFDATSTLLATGTVLWPHHVPGRVAWGIRHCSAQLDAACDHDLLRSGLARRGLR